MRICPYCSERISAADGVVCPICGYNLGQKQVGNFLVRGDGLTRKVQGKQFGSALFRICKKGDTCGISILDNGMRREQFITLDELKALLLTICK